MNYCECDFFLFHDTSNSGLRKILQCLQTIVFFSWCRKQRREMISRSATTFWRSFLVFNIMSSLVAWKMIGLRNWKLMTETYNDKCNSSFLTQNYCVNELAERYNSKVYLEPCQTSKREPFAKILNVWLFSVNYFCKALHLVCLAGFWIHLYNSRHD